MLVAGKLGLEAVILRGQVGEPLRPLRLEVTEAASVRQQTPDLAPPGLGHPDTHLAMDIVKPKSKVQSPKSQSQDQKDLG